MFIRIHPQVVVFLKRVVIAGLLSASLNLLVDQCPTVQNCAETLLHDRLEYSNLHVTNNYLQATSKTKRLAQDKLVDAILPTVFCRRQT